jgi:hypothetical protein
LIWQCPFILEGSSFVRHGFTNKEDAYSMTV